MTVDDALACAYRYLGRRERTVAETRAHLQSRGADAGAIEQAIVALTAQGYVDDRRFAALFVQDKRALEGWGEDRIKRGLAARGVEPELVQEAIADRGGADAEGQSEFQRALAVLRHRVGPGPGDRRQRERALGLLLRKGYDYELACDALRTHLRDAANAG